MKKHPLNWFQVTVHHPPVAGEAVSALLFEEGASGVWEDQPDNRGRVVTKAGFPQESAERLESYLPELINKLVAIFESSPEDFELYMGMEKNHDWAEKWKEGLNPITVNSQLAIAPSWWPENDLPKANSILRIDPGLAFGSGHHASTFMCLKLLSENTPNAKRVLDVGSGSGILALAVAALNAEAEIIGVDNDSDTLEVAEKNAEDNQLGRRVSFNCRHLDSLIGFFDLIAANITLAPLKELAPDISKLATDEGALVLSGLLDSQVEEIISVYEALGWVLQQRLDRDEWAALLLKKGAPPKNAQREEV